MKLWFTALGYDPVMPMGSFDPRQFSLESMDNAELVTKNMREVAGSKCDLLIKTHGQITTSSAIRLAKSNFLIQESIETFGGFYARLLKKPIQRQDGFIIPPTDPSIGNELNEVVADAHRYRGERVFPPMAEKPVVLELPDA